MDLYKNKKTNQLVEVVKQESVFTRFMPVFFIYESETPHNLLEILITKTFEEKYERHG